MNIIKRKLYYQPLPHSREWLDRQNTNYPHNILSEKAKSFFDDYKNVEDVLSDYNYDLVYILKPSENNLDLKMSLRSICKFCNFRKVWLVGYKPQWVKNVRYIPTTQNQDKWKNSIINYMAACKCNDISENFILMNDDFFALRPIRNWKENLNVCLGTLEEEVQRNIDNPKRSRWKYGFDYAVDLLPKLNCKYQFNFETHLPIIINKQNFINMMNLPKIQKFSETRKVLHKRSVYKNLYLDKDIKRPRKIDDVKITLGQDLSDNWLNEDWLSVFDDVVGNNKQFPKLNQFLNCLFPDKCKFEV